MHKRSFLKTTVALATLAWGAAHAADTPLKFQLDWRFEGPAALFVHPEQKGYFKQAGLDVTVEAASGAGEMSFRDAKGHGVSASIKKVATCTNYSSPHKVCIL